MDQRAGHNGDAPPELSGAPAAGLGELREFEADYTIEQFTQRDLMLDLGALLWFAMVVISLAAGQFDPAAESTLQTVFRFSCAAFSATLAVLMLTTVRRLDDQRTQTVLSGTSFVALGMLLALSYYGPGALGAMMVGQVAVTIYTAQFVSARTLTGILSVISVTAGIAAAHWYDNPDAHYIVSNTVLLVIILWATGFSIRTLSADRIAALEEAERAAFSDPLTGLPNTRMLRRRIEPMLDARNLRIHGRTGVVVLDLDGFRAANMLRGHRVGDRLLRTVARAMSASAGGEQIVARTGSDEFTVLVPDASRDELEELNEHFRDAVLTALAAETTPGMNIDASVGFAISGSDCSTFRELMRSADRRMYVDKATHDPHQLHPPAGAAAPTPEWNASEPRAARPASRWDRLRWSSRPSQVKFTSITWLVSGVAAAIALRMPDAIPHKDPLFELLVASAIIAAVLRYVSEPATRLWQQLLDVAAGCLVLSLGIYATGGSASALWPIALLIFIYIGWFLPLKWVPAGFVGALVILLAPLPLEGGGTLVLMDGVTIGGGVIVSFALLGILYFNHYYVERARALTAQLASLDPRAGAFNRRAFEERMSEELDRLSYGDRDALAVVMVDLGNFKSVSANYGRTIGDRMLTEVASALAAASREEDCVARLGGDEFAVVAPGVDAESARALAQRLVDAVREALERTDLPSNEEVRPSAGFALYGMHGRTTDELVTAADVALTAAKTSGRDPNRVSSFVVAL